jgi:predicted nucleic acid-binding protein
MVIVDTTVWIDFFCDTGTPHVEWLEQELERLRLGLLDLILCELLQGVPNDKQAAELQQELARFEIYDTGGRALAVAAARNYRSLRSKGFTVRKTIDCLIATFCLQNDHTLLHNDRDFDLFEQELGLRVVHP